jgi:hypothetical protein
VQSSIVTYGIRGRRLAYAGVAMIGALLFSQSVGSAAEPDVFSLQRAVALPGGLPITQIDISWVDPFVRAYFLADGTNASVDMIDLNTGAVSVIKGTGRNAFAGKPFDPNSPARNEVTGPNGVTTVNHAEIWAGDAPSLAGPLVLSTNLVTAYANDNCDSSVKVININDKVVTDVINLGGCFRSDELAFDPADQIVLIANPSELPIGKGPSQPFISLISAAPVPFGTHHAILKKITFDGTGGTPNAAGGIEQPVYSPQTGMFYIALPQNGPTDTNGAVVVVDPKQLAVTRIISLTHCMPNGLALGPNGAMFLGCTGTNPVQVVDIASGNSLATISQVVGCDEVWYNPGDDHYLGACGSAVSIIDATPVSLDQKIAGISHSITADPLTNQIYAPIPSTNSALCGSVSTVGCIGIFCVPATQAILNVPVTTTSQQQIIIDASASTSASGLLKYQFVAIPGANGRTPIITQAPFTGQAIVFFNGGPGNYSFQVTVVDGAGNSSTSAPVTINYTGA